MLLLPLSNIQYRSLPRLLLILLACILPATALASDYRFVGNPISKTYSIEDHQSGNQIWWIDQYHDGKVLFATGNGLASWDGENWLRSNVPNNTRVRDISIWKDQNIYAGAVGQLGYFSLNHFGEFEFTLIPTSHLIEDFGQTRGVNSNQDWVVYSTEQTVLVWNGQDIQKVENFNPRGSRVFKIDDQLLVTDRKRLYVIDGNGSSPSAKPLDWKFPANMRIKSLFKNQSSQVIMVTNMHGVFQLVEDTFVNIIAPDTMPITYLNSGIQAKDGFYYFNSTIDGLLIYSSSFELQRHYKQSDGLGLSTIYTIFQDQQENIWIGGLPNISVFQPPHLRSTYTSDTATVDFENIYQLNDNIYFSGTGFYQLTHPEGLTRSPEFKQISDFNLVVLDIIEVGDEFLVGTENGIYAFDKPDPGNTPSPARPRLISSENFVSELALSADSGYVYATLGNHLVRLEKVEGKWRERLLLEDKSGTENLMVQPISQDKHVVWFTTEQQELYRVEPSFNDAEPLSFDVFKNTEHPLGRDHITPFMLGTRALFGTQDGVIEYLANSKTFSQAHDFPLPLQSKNRDVFKVEVDERSRIWYHAGTETGVAYQDEMSEYTFHESLFKPFNRSGTRGLVHFDNSIWIGTANGKIHRLSDQTIATEPQKAKLSIQHITSRDGNKRLSLKDDVFAVKDNSIRIRFSLSENSSLRKPLYRTKTTGYGSQDWTPWSKEAYKDFTSLSGGNYGFHLQAQDPWGRQSSLEYRFSVAYPWYASKIAQLVYLALFLFVIYLSVKTGQKLRNRALEQHNQELEIGIKDRTLQISQKVEQLKEQQVLKDKFFANVSHEFRTPLTLTIGPLETILKEQNAHLNDTSKDLAITALTNAKTMLALVGQVLDMNRLEVGKLSLRISEYDIAQMLRINQARFLPWAKQNSQTIQCINCENPHNLYFDQDQIDKCISNLLSNAIKYSGNDSTIKIELVHQADCLEIKISDDGRGIDCTHKSQVFDRFHQENNQEISSVSGTGIGLSIVKELVELHSGSIELETSLGLGCQFSIKLPYGNSHFTQLQLVEPITQGPASEDISAQLNQGFDSKTKILIVDDNTELRNFICQRLQSSFTILEAENGESGFVAAIKHLPDVVISDITMPILSGIELTKKLKLNTATMGIPVLLLSAQTTKRDIVVGFESGADDYLIKPFDTSELIMRVKALIASRKAHALQKVVKAPTLDNLGSHQGSFEEDLKRHVYANISNNEFNIEDLAQLMFMSKETLRRKCQALYHKSPAAFIQETRILQAKILLEEKQLNVSEVSYATGFDSLSYFSRVFKKHYGVSPSSLL